MFYIVEIKSGAVVDVFKTYAAAALCLKKYYGESDFKIVEKDD